jgi:hypothetical protein
MWLLLLLLSLHEHGVVLEEMAKLFKLEALPFS